MGRFNWQSMEQISAVRSGLVAIGMLLILITPAVGVLPGPGGVFVFAAGAALVLKYSQWGKRLYVRLNRRFPKAVRLVRLGAAASQPEKAGSDPQGAGSAVAGRR
jgi:hypothetical protein